MAFWDLSDGSSAATGATEYETAGGDFENIPEGTRVIAAVDDAKWDTTKQEAAEFLSLRWTISAPEQYANRKIFQKLWLTDANPKSDADKAGKKRDADMRKLSAIDANAGGKLAKLAGKPTDEQIMLALVGKDMVIELRIWEMADKSKSGNWIANIYPKSKCVKIVDAPAKPAQAAKVQTSGTLASGGGGWDYDDDIPF
jgi:hypothetical protein